MGLLFSEKRCTYIPEGKRERRGCRAEEITAFARKHTFFSSAHPLIGVVTEREQDLWLVADLLKEIHVQVPREERPLMVWEVLTKVLAYRSLRQGMELLIPMEARLVRYRVDRVIWLEEGMPAFGLLPEERESFPALLLFRGTELSWKGRRSIASDFDHEGVGYRCYQRAHLKVFDWLKGVRRPLALGYSLGGALATYALFFNPEHIEAAISFSPPGLAKKPLQRWRASGVDAKLKTVVTRGDCVPLYGELVGRIDELVPARPLRPIAAHTLLVTAQPLYYLVGTT